MNPTVGRAVHYVARGSADRPPACRAATVTEVGPDDRTLGLAVLNPTGLFFHPLEAGGVDYDGGTRVAGVDVPSKLCDGRYHVPGSWHWPAQGER